MKAHATLAFVVVTIFVMGAVLTVLWLAPILGGRWRAVDTTTIVDVDAQPS